MARRKKQYVAMNFRIVSLVLGLIVFFFFPQFVEGQKLLPRREKEPIVLEGSKFSSLIGKKIKDIIIYQYNDVRGWSEIPFQIDERDLVTAKRIYGDINPGDCFNDSWCSGLENLKILTYTDKNTFTGPDSDPTFDVNDELVFMAKDAGRLGPEANFPDGVISGSGVKVSIFDPIDDNEAFVYLFLKDLKSNNTPSVPAEQYVNYDFNLVSGSYKNSYSQEKGPNIERSLVSTLFYKIGFTDRWIRDEIRITAGLSNGSDILDRHKMLFAPDICERHEETFSYGEGAFIVNKSGPVRAIRAYMGANSGPLTQREHIFYDQKEVVTTWLRVHPIQGIMDFYDYSANAVGMEYSNNNTPDKVIIDGIPESVKEGKLEWELLTGEQGTLFMSHELETSISSLAESSYYLDKLTPNDPQCTGDELAIGASGVWIKSQIENTDIRIEEKPSEFKLTRTSYFSGPNEGKNLPELYAENKQKSLEVYVNALDREEDIFKVYPNPFEDELNIKIEKSGVSIVSVLIWNLLGKLEFQESFVKTNSIKINTARLTSGIHIIQIKSDSGISKNIKLFKQ